MDREFSQGRVHRQTPERCRGSFPLIITRGGQVATLVTHAIGQRFAPLSPCHGSWRVWQSEPLQAFACLSPADASLDHYSGRLGLGVRTRWFGRRPHQNVKARTKENYPWATFRAKRPHVLVCSRCRVGQPLYKMAARPRHGGASRPTRHSGSISGSEDLPYSAGPTMHGAQPLGR